MIPALRSASMLICLPGMASSVNRADTSATRPAPLVMTMKLMMVRMMKMTTPTMKLPCTTNCPNAVMRLPASPWVRMARVVAMLSPSRKSVTKRSRVGKTLKSVGRLILAISMMISTEIAMLRLSRASIIQVGRGKTRMKTMPIMAMLKSRLPRLIRCSREKPCLFI